jgi:chromosome segregation ATPase
MITLKQIQTLEEKIGKAVGLIDVLRQENSTLKQSLEKTQSKVRDLEKMVDGFKNDQEAIEEGILKAIEKLDQLEDELSEKEPEDAAQDIEATGSDNSNEIAGGEEEGKKKELDIF